MARYLYVMLSRTDTAMGRLIRFCTREEYNHVSLALDAPDRFVSFARYCSDVPLAGGYVTEPSARFLFQGRVPQVRIYRLELSEEDAGALEQLFGLAGHRESALLYNSLGALLTPCHIPCHIPGAYTCLEFAGAILGSSFSSIQALGDALAPWEIYRGELPHEDCPSADCSDPFFRKRSFLRGTKDTALHFNALLWRLLRLRRPADPISFCCLDILNKNKNAV